MSEQQESSSQRSSGSSDSESVDRIRLQELEARALAKAKATAEAAFRPSPSILNATSSRALLDQVDGASLSDYEAKESIYVGTKVPVAAGIKLTVPIQVSTPGSVVEYAVELMQFDIAFGISAEREEGVTVVRNLSRMDASMCPVTQKFLVGTTPCMILLVFDNEYSWIREKNVSYKLTVTPPSKESLAAGRRRRAIACLKAVEDDLQSASQRLQTTSQQQTVLADKISKLQAELNEARKASQIVEKELSWLNERKALRIEQQKLLKERLEHGWEDEKSIAETKTNCT